MSQPKHSLDLDDIAKIVELSASADDPKLAFAAADVLASHVFGHRLFTVLRYIAAEAAVERLYSSNPTAYPVGGRKQKEGTRWGEIVLDRGEVYIARNETELREAFSDHALITSLGIGSIMNVPIRFRGVCIGTMNICGAFGQYGEADVAPGRILAGLLVPLLLDHR